MNQAESTVVKKYELSEEAKFKLENNFKYHSPKEDQQYRYVELRNKAKELAKMMNEYVKPSRELSEALTCLETASMWTNAGIARNE